MSYVFVEAESLESRPAVGNKQCVTLVKHFTGAPASSLWKEGQSVRGNLLLRKGTAIATFVNGRYPNLGTGNRAALYVGQDASGLFVVDQWRSSGAIKLRKLPFQGMDRAGNYISPSNNGDAFSVVE